MDNIYVLYFVCRRERERGVHVREKENNWREEKLKKPCALEVKNINVLQCWPLCCFRKTLLYFFVFTG